MGSSTTAGVPPFGVVAAVESGFVVLLHRGVSAQIVTPALSFGLCGRTALTWVDQILARPVESIAVTCTEGTPVRVDPMSDLRSGLVAGVGFVVTPRSPVADAESSDGISSETTGPATDISRSTGCDDAGPRRPGSDGQKPPSAAAPATALSQTAVGVLVADDGARFTLDRRYVLGRDPYRDPAVRRGEASPIVVVDAANGVSRIQAYLWVELGKVMVLDGASTNGTFIARPGTVDWTRLGHGPIALPPGGSLRLGHRVFTFRQTCTEHD